MKAVPPTLAWFLTLSKRLRSSELPLAPTSLPSHIRGPAEPAEPRTPQLFTTAQSSHLLFAVVAPDRFGDELFPRQGGLWLAVRTGGEKPRHGDGLRGCGGRSETCGDSRSHRPQGGTEVVTSRLPPLTVPASNPICVPSSKNKAQEIHTVGARESHRVTGTSETEGEGRRDTYVISGRCRRTTPGTTIPSALRDTQGAETGLTSPWQAGRFLKSLLANCAMLSRFITQILSLTPRNQNFWAGGLLFLKCPGNTDELLDFGASLR